MKNKFVYTLLGLLILSTTAFAQDEEMVRDCTALEGKNWHICTAEDLEKSGNWQDAVTHYKHGGEQEKAELLKKKHMFSPYTFMKWKAFRNYFSLKNKKMN